MITHEQFKKGNAVMVTIRRPDAKKVSDTLKLYLTTRGAVALARNLRGLEPYSNNVSNINIKKEWKLILQDAKNRTQFIFKHPLLHKNNRSNKNKVMPRQVQNIEFV